MPSASARNAASIVVGARPAEKRLRRRRGDDATGAEEHELVTAVGLVHHVRRDEHGPALAGERVELAPEVSAEHRVEADRRLVEDEQVRVAEERGGERDARALAAREGSHFLAGVRPRPVASIVSPTRAAATPSTRAK